MALTPTAAWLAAIDRGDVYPVVSVQLDIDASTSFKWCTSDEAVISTTKGGDFLPIVGNVAPVAGTIDPLTRKVSRNQIYVTLADTGTGSHIRNVLSGNRHRNRRVIIKLGARELNAGDYLAFFRGSVADVMSDEGMVMIKVADAMSIIAEHKITVPTPYINQHPLEIIEDLVSNKAGIPSELFDATSLDPDTYTASISHLAVSRDIHNGQDARVGADHNVFGGGKIFGGYSPGGFQVPDVRNALPQDETSVRTLVDQLSELLIGSLVPREDGKLTFVRYDNTAATDDDWTADDIEGIEVESTVAQLYNRLYSGFSYNFDKGDTQFFTTMIDDDSLNAYPWPALSESPFDYRYDSQWVNSMADLGAYLSTSGLSLTLKGGNLDSFAGMRNDGSSGWTLSASRPAYFFLWDESRERGEVVKCTAATLDTAVKNIAGNCVKATFTIPASGRDQENGGAATGREFSVNSTLVWDVTPIWDRSQDWVGRVSNGLAIVKVRTTLGKYALQLGDYVSITDDVFLSFGQDGLTGSDKWEIIRKETDALGDSPGVTWTLAAVRTASFTEDRSGTPFDRGKDIFGKMGTWWGDKIFVPPFVDRGLKGTATGGFSIDILGGELFGSSGPVVVQDISATVAANKDTFFRFDSIAQTLNTYELATGSPAPAVTRSEVDVATAVAGASQVDTIVDRRKTGISPVEHSIIGGANRIPNGTFAEHRRDPDRYAPEHIEVAVGTWATDVTATAGTGLVKSGAKAIKFNANLNGEINSTPISIVEGYRYSAIFDWRGENTTGSDRVQGFIDWLQGDRVTVVSTTAPGTKTLVTAGAFQRDIAVFQAPALARYARLRFRNHSGVATYAYDAYLDNMTLEPAEGFFAVQTAVQTLTKNVWNKINFGQEIDPSAGFSVGSDEYTVAEDGLYAFSASVRMNPGADYHWIALFKNGTIWYEGDLADKVTSAPSVAIGITLYRAFLRAGDLITLRVYVRKKDTDTIPGGLNNAVWFTGGKLL